jgi:hypothetical protein
MAKQVLYRTRPRWSEIFIYAALGLGPLGLAVASSAQALPTRFAIEAPQVMRAMEAASLPAEGVEVKLAAPITTSRANALIEVKTVTSIGHHAVRLRLACRDHSECIPFFAEVTFPDSVDVTRLYGVKTSRVAAVQSPESANPASVSDSAPKPPAIVAAVLRAGSPAMLAFDADRIHIRLEVISLQTGSEGSHIRVSSLDHKQIYVAQVVTPTLLKGELLR